MCFEFEFETGFNESCTAPSLSSKTGKHGSIPLQESKKRHTCLKNNNAFDSIARREIFCLRCWKGNNACCLRSREPTHTYMHLHTYLLRQIQTSYQLPYWCSLHQQRLPKKYLHIHVLIWKVIPKSEVPFMYARISSIDFRWTTFGAEKYYTIDRTALEMSGRAEIAKCVKLLTSSRNGQFSLFSS